MKITTLILAGLGLLVLVAIFNRWRGKRTDFHFWLRWFLTVVAVADLGWSVTPAMRHGGIPALFGLLEGVFCGGMLAVAWSDRLCNWVASPFTSLFSPNQAAEPMPLYSAAEARIKQGHYREAMAEVWGQLVRFPDDLQGHMMIAEIRARHLRQVEEALSGLEEFLNTTSLPRHAAVAVLNRIAEYRLRLQKDVPGATEALRRIVREFPHTESAALAEQRLAHIGDPENLQRERERRLKVTAVEGYPGLQDRKLEAPDPHSAIREKIRNLLAQLDRHPHDYAAREELVHLHAFWNGDAEAAFRELDILLKMPHAPTAKVVAWLNTKADIAVKVNHDIDAARRDLETIVRCFPESSAAIQAEKRIHLLGRELKACQERRASIKLGTYEQNIGLKQKPHPE